MRVRLVAFASAREALGSSQLEIELAAGADLVALRDELCDRYPDLAPLWPRLAIAVGGALAPADRVLTDGEEVALLPPVSGG